MGRYCAECDQFNTRSNFSRNQWTKGDGGSRCKDCVNGICRFQFQCHECNRQFNNQNELNMHAQVHRPNNFACPVCGDRRFKSGANAVQHVESGSCSGCRGSDNARKVIYGFARNQSAMRPYMSDVPQLEYGDYDNDGTVPDYPYTCRTCNVAFKNASQLLQHNDNKHNNHRLLAY